MGKSFLISKNNLLLDFSSKNRCSRYLEVTLVFLCTSKHNSLPVEKYKIINALKI